MLLMHKYDYLVVHLLRADIFLLISKPLSLAVYLEKPGTQEIREVRGMREREESQTLRPAFDLPRESDSLSQDP